MKALPFKSVARAFTVIELLVIIATIVVIACILVPAAVRQQRQSPMKNCQNNLKQIGLGFKTFAVDQFDDFSTHLSTQSGGSLELIESGLVFVHFRPMSNELSTPKILVCPRDPDKIATTNFNSTFSDTNVSYFVSTDAKDTYPQMLLSGDRNLALNKASLKPGLFALTTNNAALLSWTKAIHNSCGNIGFADGSVQFTDSKKLSYAAQNQGSDTNRLAIP
jgi:prepilin-type processing-associated H-X9-DG protein